MENVNWLGFILATLTPMIVGFIWYHKSVFGKAWMDSIGMTEEKIQQGNMAVTFGLSIILSALIAFLLINNVNSPGQEGGFDSFKHGAFHGMFLAVTVAIPILVTNGLFEQKSAKNMLINSAYWLVSLSLMGGILDAMNHWPDVIGM